ncbi:MAG: hypothetical protein WBY53_05775 [Acidobacteriaceae bacterium]
MTFCLGSSAAKKRYQRDSLRWMVVYFIALLCSSWFVKHDGGQRFLVYFWSVLPSIPVLAILWRMGTYLREETDEYLRWMTMQSILVGTGVLLAAVMVSDFLRAFAHTGTLPPFAAFLIFWLGMMATQAWQWMQNRPVDA